MNEENAQVDELGAADSGAVPFLAVDGGLHGTPHTLLHRRLGVGSIVFMVVAAAAPLTTAAAITPVVFAASGNVGAPVYFLIAAGILTLFAVGFTSMSKYVKNAGAFYSYVKAGLGRIAGVGAAILALVSYFIMLVAVYALVGMLVGNVVATYTGAAPPWWLWSIFGWLIVGFLGYRDIELSAKVLAIALILEALVVIVLDVAIIVQGGEAGLNLSPFAPSEFLSGAVGLGVMFALLGFIGFEATAVFRNEARDPDRTIPKATYIAVIGIGLFYAFAAWAAAMGTGVDNAVEVASTDPDNMVLGLAKTFVAPVFFDIMQILVATSIFACALSFHNVVTRYQFTLANFRVLPRMLGAVSEKHRAPSTSSIVLSLLTGVSIAIVITTGLDPYTAIYTWLSGAATLGIIALMALTSLAVIVFFRRHSFDKRLWHTMIAPVGALLGLGTVLVLVLSNFPLLVGGVVESAVIVSVLVAAFVGGVFIALHMRARRPDDYLALSEFE